MNSSNEISENALMLETIFSNTHFMIAYMDKNFNFVKVNDTYAKKNNKAPDFFVGKNHFDLYPHKGNKTIFQDVVETGKPYFAYSMPLEHPELGITYWDWVIQPVKEDNEVTGILLSLTDVTEYERNEENILKNQKKFMEKLAEKRAHELLMEQEESANIEIRQLNQRISELKKANEEFKETISKYENSHKEYDEFDEKLIEKRVNEILDKQTKAEELLIVREQEVEKREQKIAELEKANDEFKEIISKYEDSKIENEEFIAKLMETHAKELEEIKEQENKAITKLVTAHAKDIENLKEMQIAEDTEDILNKINDAVIVIDNKLRIKMWNDTAQQIYGWKENEVVGKIAYEIFKSRNTPIERLEILEYLRNNENLNSEFVHHDRNGKPLNIRSTITVKHDDNGRIMEYIIVNQDISELIAKNELLGAANLEIMQLNQKVTGLENANDALKEIISKNDNLEELIEERVNEVLKEQEESKELLKEKKWEVEEKEQKIAELENTNKDIIAYISKLEDSKIDSAESQNDIHEEQLKKLTYALNRSNEEFQQFAYITSHDLQEPLRTISSFAQLLAKRYEDKVDEDGREFIEYITEASIRMQQMIKDLLQYSRIVSRGKEFKPTNTEEIVQYTISSLKNSIDGNDVEITYENLPKVTADSGQLLQLFHNLVGNAIKFRQFQIPPKIHISAVKDEENNEYIFSVADNGIGIEEEYFDRIFTIFQKLHTREEYPGTGMGLSVAKRIVERHGGRIWVESEPDVGSTFYFSINSHSDQ